MIDDALASFRKSINRSSPNDPPPGPRFSEFNRRAGEPPSYLLNPSRNSAADRPIQNTNLSTDQEEEQRIRAGAAAAADRVTPNPPRTVNRAADLAEEERIKARAAPGPPVMAPMTLPVVEAPVTPAPSEEISSAVVVASSADELRDVVGTLAQLKERVDSLESLMQQTIAAVGPGGQLEMMLQTVLKSRTASASDVTEQLPNSSAVSSPTDEPAGAITGAGRLPPVISKPQPAALEVLSRPQGALSNMLADDGDRKPMKDDLSGKGGSVAKSGKAARRRGSVGAVVSSIATALVGDKGSDTGSGQDGDEGSKAQSGKGAPRRGSVKAVVSSIATALIGDKGSDTGGGQGGNQDGEKDLLEDPTAAEGFLPEQSPQTIEEFVNEVVSRSMAEDQRVAKNRAWERKNTKLRKYYPLLYPESTPKLVWDRFISVTILYNLFASPMLLGKIPCVAERVCPSVELHAVSTLPREPCANRLL